MFFFNNLCFSSSSPAAFEWFEFNSSFATHLHVMAISDILGDLEPAGILHLLLNSSYVFSSGLEKNYLGLMVHMAFALGRVGD